MFYATNYTPDPGRLPSNIYGIINITNGSFTPLGDQTFGQQTSSNWYGLTANESLGVLYVMDIEKSPTLRRLIPGGTIEQIGSGIGIDVPFGIEGMAYDNRHGVLYATGYYHGDPHLFSIAILAPKLLAPLD